MPNAQAKAQAIRRSVERRQITTLWHVSRLSQLESIFTSGGLHSRRKMDALSIHYQESSWGTYGKAEDMKDYICCALVRPWGMSRQDPEEKVMIRCHPRLLWRTGTLFSPDWSSNNDITLTQLLKRNPITAFESMFDNPTTYFPSPPSVEVLIPHSISTKFFLPSLDFYDDDSRNRALEEIGTIRFSNGKTVAQTFQFNTDPYSFRGNS